MQRMHLGSQAHRRRQPRLGCICEGGTCQGRTRSAGEAGGWHRGPENATPTPTVVPTSKMSTRPIGCIGYPTEFSGQIFFAISPGSSSIGWVRKFLPTFGRAMNATPSNDIADAELAHMFAANRPKVLAEFQQALRDMGDPAEEDPAVLEMSARAWHDWRARARHKGLMPQPQQTLPAHELGSQRPNGPPANRDWQRPPQPNDSIPL